MMDGSNNNGNNNNNNDIHCIGGGCDDGEGNLALKMSLCGAVTVAVTIPKTALALVVEWWQRVLR